MNDVNREVVMEKREDAKRIGLNILDLLIEREMVQQDLAKALSVSKSTVAAWIHGKRIPRMGVLTKMSDIFGVPKSVILGEAAGVSLEPELHKKTVLDVLEEREETLRGVHSKTVRIITDALRADPRYDSLFVAASKVNPESIELVVKLLEKFRD